jgi:hypothetical protein
MLETHVSFRHTALVKSQIVAGALLAGIAMGSTSAFAESRHAANDRAVLRASVVTAYQGGTFSMLTTCPEPSYSTRLTSDLFRSPALMPARVSAQVSWTVAVATKQRPGEYWISLNCFHLLTGRVGAKAEIRVRVMGALLKAPRPQPRSRHQLRPQFAVRPGRLGTGREGGNRGALHRHPLDKGKSRYDGRRNHRLF